jgi:hypothetical protein
LYSREHGIDHHPVGIIEQIEKEKQKKDIICVPCSKKVPGLNKLVFHKQVLEISIKYIILSEWIFFSLNFSISYEKATGSQLLATGFNTYAISVYHEPVTSSQKQEAEKKPVRKS